MDNTIITSMNNLPVKLPIFPLDGPPLFPGMITQMLISKKEVINIIEKAEKNNGFLGLVLMKNPRANNPFTFNNLYTIGTVARIHKKIPLPEGEHVSVFLALLERFTIVDCIKFNHPLVARVKYPPSSAMPKGKKDPELVALTRSLVTETKLIIANNPVFSEDIRLNMGNIEHPGQIADFITSILNIKREEQQEILETFDLNNRIIKVLAHLSKEKEVLEIQQKVQTQINDTVDQHRRELFLREMLKEIRSELGEPVDGKTAEAKQYKKQLALLPLDADTKTQLEKEIKKFELLDTHHPEYNVLSSYLEKVMDLPWMPPPMRNLTIQKTKKILQAQHYGMEKVKERIVEHIAIQHFEKSDMKSIICLVGPPGVGKTSIARAIAEAMGRKLYHFSVGGMRDEAEIKGHRRTYIGAMPGKIIQGLLHVREKDPVFVIDEIDKLSNTGLGDPSSALLEVLDPVQNVHFKDLYINVPFDLSKIFFITTANSLHAIPRPLIDRMEIIQLSGYIDEEKVSIAKKYIIPRSLATHGLHKKSILFTQKTLRLISECYAREAGMRTFEQCVNKIVRKIATQYITEKEAKEKEKKTRKKKDSYWPVEVNEHTLEQYLGIAPFRENIHNRASIPGTAVGLAWTAAGGDVLIIEAQAIKEKPKLKLTGTLGDVMKESAHIAYTIVRQYVSEIAQKNPNIIDGKFFDEHEIHLHVPEGATPKDGPSAGITMSSAFLSLVLKKTITPNFAMTGEVSLVKQVLPIGGLREKIVAARRNNIKNIIIPKANVVDLEEIPAYITKNVNIYPVHQLEEVFALLFPSLKLTIEIPKKIAVMKGAGIKETGIKRAGKKKIDQKEIVKTVNNDTIRKDTVKKQNTT